MLIYTSNIRLILTHACMTWSYAVQTLVKLLIKSLSYTVRQILDMPWYIRNFYAFEEIDLPRLNIFIQRLKLTFGLNQY